MGGCSTRKEPRLMVHTLQWARKRVNDNKCRSLAVYFVILLLAQRVPLVIFHISHSKNAHLLIPKVLSFRFLCFYFLSAALLSAMILQPFQRNLSSDVTHTKHRQVFIKFCKADVGVVFDDGSVISRVVIPILDRPLQTKITFTLHVISFSSSPLLSPHYIHLFQEKLAKKLNRLEIKIALNM